MSRHRPTRGRRRPLGRLRAEAHALRITTVIARDGNRCVWCTTPLRRDPTPPGRSMPSDQVTLDHLLPISHGGPNWLANLVPACHTCNQRRGDRSIGRFL